MNLYSLYGLLIAITSGSIAYIVYANKIKLPHYLSFNISVAYWSFLYFIWLNVPYPKISLWLIRFVAVGMIIIPPLFVNFCYEFTKKKNKTFLTNNVLIAFFTYLVFFTDAYIKSLNPNTMFYFWPIAGKLFGIYLAFFTINFSLGLYIVRSSFDTTKKHYIFIGSLIAILGTSTNFFLWYNILIPPFGNILVLFIVFIAFAVVKKRLVDVSFLIGNTVASIITICIYSALYLTLTLLGNTLNLVYIHISSFYNLTFFIFSCETFQILKKKIQSVPLKLIVKNYYDKNEIFEIFKNSLQKCLTFKECILITKSYLKIYSKACSVDCYTIENYDSTKPLGDKLILRHFGDKADTMDISIRLSHPLIKKVINNKTVLTRSEMPLDFQHHFFELNAQVIIPVFAEKYLIALFTLSGSENGNFTSNDIAFFGLLSSHLGLVLDTMRAHDMVKVAFKKAQKTASMLSLMNQYQHDIKACWTVLQSKVQTLNRTENETQKLANLLKGIEPSSSNKEVTPKNQNWEQNYKTVTELIEKQANRATSLSATMGKILSGKEYHHFQPIKLQKVVSSAIELFPVVETCIQQKFENESRIIQGDLVDLQILIINILKNSYEAYLSNGISESFLIKIHTEIHDDKIVLIISDNSGGMPQELMNLIKEKSPVTTKADGSGVGLMTIKRIMTDHQGDVDIYLNECNGTTFKLWFPLGNF